MAILQELYSPNEMKGSRKLGVLRHIGKGVHYNLNVLIALIDTHAIKKAQTQTRATGDMFGTSSLGKARSFGENNRQ